MTTTIRARGPRELLAYIPFRLGYRPQDSGVLVSLRTSRGRVGLVARVDLDDLADLEHGPQVARTLVSHLCSDGAARAVLVLYADVDLRAGGATAARERAAVEHWTDAAEEYLGEPEVWVVSATGYHGADCQDETCCPPGGRPLADLEATEVGAHMVLAGATVAPSRSHATSIPVLDTVLRRKASRAANRWRARRDAAIATHDHEGLAAWRQDGLAAWRAATGLVERAHRGLEHGAREALPAAVPATVLGRLEVALESVPVRDAVLLSFVAGNDELATLAAADVAGEQVETGTAVALAAVVDPVAGLPPDPLRARCAREVLEAVAGAGRRGAQAPALTLLALLAWWDGDGVLASDRLAAALDADPSYRLALLVERALDAGLAPGWARQQGRPWQAT
ncbi:DUF4192 family protein [Oerskovia turbata]|uniref:DUF4192 family protein n=1 Tax=Oerskovia turbata TaxID=1713 RepID=A0A4Q1KPJ2_9CELL|nr:DUF4192 domain-containing protein [Oerskovia turbata]RXR23158.1 DUF4192 family protein [Oerskovia turbata]RXR31898.1 DUF4192 family protein [Oerskovia turbata]